MVELLIKYYSFWSPGISQNMVEDLIKQRKKINQKLKKNLAFRTWLDKYTK